MLNFKFSQHLNTAMPIGFASFTGNKFINSRELLNHQFKKHEFNPVQVPLWCFFFFFFGWIFAPSLQTVLYLWIYIVPLKCFSPCDIQQMWNFHIPCELQVIFRQTPKTEHVKQNHTVIIFFLKTEWQKTNKILVGDKCKRALPVNIVFLNYINFKKEYFSEVCNLFFNYVYSLKKHNNMNYRKI